MAQNSYQGTPEKSQFSVSLTNSQKNLEGIRKQVETARLMKVLQYDLLEIFEATGLQPEIIQSL